MQRTLSRAALGGLAAILLLAVACGGGGGGSPKPLSSDSFKDPVSFARAYYVTLFRASAGTAKPEDVLALFEDSCRSTVNLENVNKGIAKGNEDYPKLKGVKIDDIDLGNKVKVEKHNDGATVTVPASKDMRIRVNGKWLNASDFFISMGIGDANDPDEPEEEEFKFANNRYYVADCDMLEYYDRLGAPEETPTPTPTPARSTPTPARTTPTVTANRTPAPAGTSRPGVSSNLSNSDVEAYTKRYYMMFLSAHTGTFDYDNVVSFYTPECRAKSKRTDVMAGLIGASLTYPKAEGDRFEDMDFGGKLKIVAKSGGYDVELPPTNEIRLKVKGSFVNMHTYMQSVGLVRATATGNATSKQSFIVQDGKLYDADCDFLEALAK